MKKSLFCLFWALLVAGCGQNADRRGKDEPRFTDEVVIKTTPVKDQGESELCWAYAMLGAIESEHLMQGDSVDLSVDYVARRWLPQLTRRCFLDGRHPEVSLRGMAPMLIHLIQTYGAEPFDAYHNYDGVNYTSLAKKLTQMARAASSVRQLDQRVDDVLDQTIGYMPKYLGMLGAQYTPLEFAHSVCLPDEWEGLTSFTHHPFGERFALEVPDNLMWDEYLNLPLDEFMGRIEDSIRKGHPVCWEGDISEPGFDFEGGVARLTGNGDATQERRQHDFEAHHTTDDHCLVLCGIAYDHEGNLYFRAKNSWGKQNRYGGFMYLSEDYVRMKTIIVMVKKD